MKILLAGILGAVAMFIWTSIAHMALPLGEAGISEIPNEQAVLAAMQSNIAEKSGLYFFPGPGVGPNATRQERNEAMKQEAAKMASGPSGLLLYNYARPFVFAKALTIEFATELVESILVVFLLAFMMVKAAMIGGNFMHLRYERPSLAVMVAGGILITSLILFSFISREAHHVARSLSN